MKIKKVPKSIIEYRFRERLEVVDTNGYPQSKAFGQGNPKYSSDQTPNMPTMALYGNHS